MHNSASTTATLAAVILSLGSTGAWGQQIPTDVTYPSLSDDGTVHMPAMSVPVSPYMSDEARHEYLRHLQSSQHARAAEQTPAATEPPLSEKQREAADRAQRPAVERAVTLHPVSIQHQEIAGVPTDVIQPKEGVSAGNRHRVLISLHGGSYGYWSGGQLRFLEAVTVAGFGRIKVVSVDYRLLPQYRFPAAVEDVIAVYKELLKTYKPKNIGIYGCSTGAALTGATVARLRKEGLPRPGAIGLFCEGAIKDDALEGDSVYVGQGLMGDRPPEIGANTSNPYMAGTDPRDPLVAPVASLEVLSRFPPTLLISGTRDFCLSSVVYTHSRLVKAGVEADLHIWDGMWHAFFLNVDLPESKDAYDVMVKFFDSHLGG
jgi:monoterpene epsilon-lactone hydrolase